MKFYEFGNCYYYNAENKKQGEALAAYSEDFFLGMWITGNKFAQTWVRSEEKSSVFELKGYIANVLKRLGVNVNLLHEENFSDELITEGQLAKNNEGKIWLRIGLVTKKLLKQFDIDNDVFYAEISWNNLLKLIQNHQVRYSEISKFPEVKRDLALLLNKDIEFNAIETIAYESERKLLKSVTLFDVYEGKNLEAGKKSYAVSFILQDKDKTLTDKQIDAIMGKIQKNLEEKLGAKLR